MSKDYLNEQYRKKYNEKTLSTAVQSKDSLDRPKKYQSIKSEAVMRKNFKDDSRGEIMEPYYPKSVRKSPKRDRRLQGQMGFNSEFKNPKKVKLFDLDPSLWTEKQENTKSQPLSDSSMLCNYDRLKEVNMGTFKKNRGRNQVVGSCEQNSDSFLMEIALGSIKNKCTQNGRRELEQNSDSVILDMNRQFQKSEKFGMAKQFGKKTTEYKKREQNSDSMVMEMKKEGHAGLNERYGILSKNSKKSNKLRGILEINQNQRSKRRRKGESVGRRTQTKFDHQKNDIAETLKQSEKKIQMAKREDLIWGVRKREKSARQLNRDSLKDKTVKARNPKEKEAIWTKKQSIMKNIKLSRFLDPGKLKLLKSGEQMMQKKIQMRLLIERQKDRISKTRPTSPSKRPGMKNNTLISLSKKQQMKLLSNMNLKSERRGNAFWTTKTRKQNRKSVQNLGRKEVKRSQSRKTGLLKIRRSMKNLTDKMQKRRMMRSQEKLGPSTQF